MMSTSDVQSDAPWAFEEYCRLVHQERAGGVERRLFEDQKREKADYTRGQLVVAQDGEVGRPSKREAVARHEARETLVRGTEVLAVQLDVSELVCGRLDPLA